jgi:hypothetical protein
VADRQELRLADVIFSGEIPDVFRDLPEWTRRTVDAVNGLPAFSIFSTQDGPNSSALTANRGTIGVDVGSSSTTVLWVQGSDGTTDWRGIV